MTLSLRQLWRRGKPTAAFYPTDGTTHEQRRGMLMLWWDSIASSISGSFYTDFVVIYMLALGASAASIGVRTSINSAAALAAPLLGAWLVERTGRRKRWVLLGGGGVGRVMLLGMAAIPFLLEGNAAISTFVALAAVQAFAGTVSIPAANSLLGDVVPVSIRGRYLGAQMMVINLARMACVPLAGWLIKQVGGVTGYQVAWFVAALTGLVATGFYARIPEPESSEGRRVSGTTPAGFARGWRVFMADRRFVLFCAINFVWTFGIQISGPFFTVHMVENLGFEVDTIAVLATVATVVNVVAYRGMGSLVDRKGPALMTGISMLLVPLMPLLWILARTPLHVAMVQSYGNLAWAGFRVAATPLILLLTPPEQRSRYVAIFNTINGLATVLGPLPASWIYAHWGFTANLVISAAGRALGGVLFLWLLKRGGLEESAQAGRIVPGMAG
jgi:MFS family permease